MDTANSMGVSRPLLRGLAIFLLILMTYNPSGVSYFHFASMTRHASVPLIAGGILLAIGWCLVGLLVYRRLGKMGFALCAIGVGVVFWRLVTWFGLSMKEKSAVEWIALLVVAVGLGISISWREIRRHIVSPQ